MKQSKHISFFTFLLVLFWLAGTLVTSFSLQKTADAQTDTNQTKISAYQVKALAPAVVSATISPNYILIFEASFFVINSPNQTFQKPTFKISFFEKIFEHLIAPKAP